MMIRTIRTIMTIKTIRTILSEPPLQRGKGARFDNRCQARGKKLDRVSRILPEKWLK